MKVIDTKIPDVKLLEPQVFGDERGFFMETFRDEWFKKNVANRTFVQENHSKSVKGVLRGLHYQTENTQGKLVRVVSGAVFDVAVDMRENSPTFGQWVGEILSAENKRQLWVPEGFAHGFLALEDDTEFMYKCTDLYSPEYDSGLLWNDETINIDWRLEEFGIKEEELTISDKDQKQTKFDKSKKYFE